MPPSFPAPRTATFLLDKVVGMQTCFSGALSGYTILLCGTESRPREIGGSKVFTTEDTVSHRGGDDSAKFYGVISNTMPLLFAPPSADVPYRLPEESRITPSGYEPSLPLVKLCRTVSFQRPPFPGTNL